MGVILALIILFVLSLNDKKKFQSGEYRVVGRGLNRKVYSTKTRSYLIT